MDARVLCGLNAEDIKTGRYRSSVLSLLWLHPFISTNQHHWRLIREFIF